MNANAATKSSIKIKRSNHGFTAKVYFCPGLVVTIRGQSALSSDEELIKMANETIDWAQSL